MYISIDTSNAIIEVDENNNTNSNLLKLYSFYDNFPAANTFNSNSHPISFDLYQEYEGKEIIFGESIISTNGDKVFVDSGKTSYYTNIANLYNDQYFQLLKVYKKDIPDQIRAYGEPKWIYNLPLNISGNLHGPFVCDIDDNGFEEVLILTYKTHCQNINRLLRSSA